MSIISISTGLVLILTTFSLMLKTAKSYRCKNRLVFDAYIYGLSKSHDNEELSKTFRCESLISLERYFNKKKRLKFEKSKEAKQLEYNDTQYKIEMTNGLNS